VNCAAAAAIMALAGKTSAQGHHVAAVARAFWPRRSTSKRRSLVCEIGQQPVNMFRKKSAEVLEISGIADCGLRIADLHRIGRIGAIGASWRGMARLRIGLTEFDWP
jgi:hypothetical protein